MAHIKAMPQKKGFSIQEQLSNAVVLQNRLIYAIETQDAIAFETRLGELIRMGGSFLGVTLRNALFKTIDLNHLGMTDVLLEHAVDLKGGQEDQSDSVMGINYLYQAFHYAIEKGSLPMIQKILGCDLDTLKRVDGKLTYNGLDAIHMGVVRGDLEIMKRLWDHNPKVKNVKRFRKYLTHTAQFKRGQCIEIAEFLLEKGVTEWETIEAGQTARLGAHKGLCHTIEGYLLAKQEKAQLKKIVQEATPKLKSTRTKTKKPIIRL